MPLGVLWVELYLAYVHSQMNPQTWTKVGANRSSRLTGSPDFWMFDPLKPPSAPLVSRRAICLAYIHSQMNLHMCATFGANRSSRLTPSQDFWICDTLPPPPPPNAPWGIEGRLVFSLCPFPDESTGMNESWCQSDSFPRRLNCWPPKTPPSAPLCLEGQFVWRISIPIWICTCVPNLVPESAQPFGSFSRICAKVSSAFRRCTRWLAQKHAKKQHLYIENYNSGPNM